MNVVYVGEQAECLHDYRWGYGPYFNERGDRCIDIFTVRTFRLFNYIPDGYMYQVVTVDGDKILCYTADDKLDRLIEYDSRKRTKILDRRSE